MSKANSKEVAVVESNLPAVLSAEEQALIARAVGDQGGSVAVEYFPKMSVVQKIPEDDDGNPIPGVKRGHIAISNGKETLYRDSIQLRIVAYRQQIMRVASKEENFKIQGQTILFSNWNEELIDTFGTTNCGRPLGKAAKALDKDKAERLKLQNPAFLHVWGLATVEGFDEPQIVHWRLRGNGYFAVNRFIDTVSDKTPLPTLTLKVTTRKEVPDGGEPFFVPVLEVDTKVAPTFDATTFEAVKKVMAFIDDQNADVHEQFKEAVAKNNRNGATDGLAAKVVNSHQAPLDVSSAYDPDLNVPFNDSLDDITE